MSLSLFWNTVKYLKPVQIYSRIWFYFYRPHPPSLNVPSFHSPDNTFISPPRKRESMLSSARFRFLNQEYDILEASDWNNSQADKLWLYNLHYFDYLNQENTEEKNRIQQQIIERWIDENPPFTGNGWEPYPLSLRIVNWIKWLLAGNLPPERMINSLYLQAWYLRRKLEFHLLGNHLLANAKSLVFAGLFFEGVEAEKWLDKGLQILGRELSEQILDDGGHFERSPMYHSIILEDLLDVFNILQVYKQGADKTKNLEELIKSNIEKMMLWLKAMCHPDQQISFFNDAVFGVASEPVKIAEYARQLGFPVTNSFLNGVVRLPDSGYVRLQKDDVVLIADVGKIGPDYLPGHAHADTLSFEFSRQKKRVFVNTGISSYRNSRERLSQRSTASHNTLMIGGKDSSEVWSSFRVARRAYPLEMEVDDKKGSGLRLVCAHNGYQRMKGRPIHRREWVLTAHSLTVKDHIRGDYSEATAFYHLYPGLTVDVYNKRLFSDDILMFYTTDASVFIEKQHYYPEFGKAVPNECLVIKPRKNEYYIKFEWN